MGRLFGCLQVLKQPCQAIPCLQPFAPRKVMVYTSPLIVSDQRPGRAIARWDYFRVARNPRMIPASRNLKRTLGPTAPGAELKYLSTPLGARPRRRSLPAVSEESMGRSSL